MTAAGLPHFGESKHGEGFKEDEEKSNVSCLDIFEESLGLFYGTRLVLHLYFFGLSNI